MSTETQAHAHAIDRRHFLLRGAGGLGTLALALSAHAGTLTYDFRLQTTEGYDVHQILMYASNGAGQDDIYFNPVTVPAAGVFQLQHTVGFDATAAMIIGVMQRNQDSNMDLVMWVSDQFAADVLGMRYSDVFPNGVNGPNPGHNAWPGLIAAAAGIAMNSRLLSVSPRPILVQISSVRVRVVRRP